MQFLLKSALCACMALSATVSVRGMQMDNLNHLSESSGKYVTVQAGELSQQTQEIWQLSHPDMPMPTPKVTALKAPQREGEMTYTVTPALAEYPELNLSPGQYSFAFPKNNPKDLYQAMYFGPDFSLPFNLPAGTYDFVLFFWSMESDGIRCILREDIEVNADMEITAEPSEATEHIAFRPVLANGERIRTELWEEVEPEKWEMKDPGNCLLAEYFTQFLYHDIEFMSYQMNIVDRTDEEGNVVTGSRPGDVWITPSSKFKVYQKTAVGQAEEGNSLIAICAEGTNSQEMSNNPANYTEPLSANFADCLIMPELEQIWADPYVNGTIGFISFLEDKFSACNSLNMGGESWNYTTFRVCNDLQWNPKVELVPQYLKIFATDSENDIKYSIIAPFYSFEHNSWVAGHQSFIFTENTVLTIAGYAEGGYIDMPYNYFYSFPVSEDIVFGDNTPVTAFLKPSRSFDYSFVGRYGEVRSIDLYSNTLSVKCDGEELCSNYLDLNKFFWSDESQREGNWSVEINNENIKVDGLQGCNHCEMNFVNGSVGLTPTVMQMQMRTVDDKVTDRFSTPDGALLTFYAGGFKFDFDPITYGQWFTYDALKEIKVEYASYGSDSFNLLAVAEDPDKFFMPGYGAYYYAALDQVTEKSSTGWYDVRISLKDSEGNTQVQTVSPAFFIESLSGVESISTLDNAVKVEGCNIIAPAGSVVFNTAGVQTGSRDLAPGVYIVRTPSCSTKCVIK